MSTKLNYAKSIRNLASLYRDMESAADALEKLGSVEQAISEAESRRDALSAQCAEITDYGRALDESIKEREAEFEKTAAGVAEAHAEILAKANLEAQTLIANAEVNVGTMMRDAKARAEDVVSASVKAKDALEARIVELKATAAAAEADINAQRKVAEEIEARIAVAKDQIAKLLG